MRTIVLLLCVMKCVPRLLLRVPKSAGLRLRLVPRQTDLPPVPA